MSNTNMIVESTEVIPAGLQKLAADPKAVQKGPNKLVFRAAAQSAEFFDHLRAHYRETRRTMVEIPCEIKILRLNGELFDKGTGTVRDVSPSGAMIGALKLDKGCYPATGFKIHLTLKSDEYAGIGIEASPVRIISEQGGLGVRFDEIFVTV